MTSTYTENEFLLTLFLFILHSHEKGMNRVLPVTARYSVKYLFNCILIDKTKKPLSHNYVNCLGSSISNRSSSLIGFSQYKWFKWSKSWKLLPHSISHKSVFAIDFEKQSGWELFRVSSYLSGFNLIRIGPKWDLQIGHSRRIVSIT